MKIGRTSRRTFALEAANDGTRPRAEILRTVFAVTVAVALIATGAIALPSLAPVEAGVEVPPAKGPQLEPQVLADIEGVHEQAGMLGGPLVETVSNVARSVPAAAGSRNPQFSSRHHSGTDAAHELLMSSVSTLPSAASIGRAFAA